MKQRSGSTAEWSRRLLFNSCYSCTAGAQMARYHTSDMDIYLREQLEKDILKGAPTLLFVEHEIWFGRQVATREILL